MFSYYKFYFLKINNVKSQIFPQKTYLIKRKLKDNFCYTFFLSFLKVSRLNKKKIVSFFIKKEIYLITVDKFLKNCSVFGFDNHNPEESFRRQVGKNIHSVDQSHNLQMIKNHTSLAIPHVIKQLKPI